MLSLNYPHNHCVTSDTLRAIRARHPLLLAAEKVSPHRWQIGHGCRWGVYPGLRINPVQAEDLFRADIQYVEALIRLHVNVAISDPEYEALVSFVFDVGPKSRAFPLAVEMVNRREVGTLIKSVPGWAEASRFGVHIGRAARFYEASLFA